MTGHGQASIHHGQVAIEVELRTVNNRFLKVVTKVSESIASLDHAIEGIVRETLKRGTVNVSIRVSQSGRNSAGILNTQSLISYIQQAKLVAEQTGVPIAYNLGELLQLPGVLESTRSNDDEPLLEASKEALRCALQDLRAMQQREGQTMADQFAIQLDQIASLKAQIETRAPVAIMEYRIKLEQRLRTTLDKLGHETTELDLLRESLLFADRTDISEEITRLSSHLSQFRQAIDQPESQGRRLDFLIQELFRETNTIGSKANDSDISQWVVSIKTTIEQMRELVQNVE
jgi:uncharacterized protein (TIGR00255 family)